MGGSRCEIIGLTQGWAPHPKNTGEQNREFFRIFVCVCVRARARVVGEGGVVDNPYKLTVRTT